MSESALPPGWPAMSIQQAHAILTGPGMPTEVAVMQSGQIGRPQFEHDTPVSRLGCR